MSDLHIDSDCAMGSAFGDVDDGFAVLYCLLASSRPVSLTAVAGNTSAESAFANLERIAAWVEVSGPGLEPPETPFECLALGPLTNVARWLEAGRPITGVWVTLGRLQTRGRWPPIWPMEFNATKDLVALHRMMRSQVPLTLVPLDVAKRLRLTREVWTRLGQSPLGRKLRIGSRRWRWRSLFVKGRWDFPVWDLVCAVACHHPEIFRFSEREIVIHANGLVLCDAKAVQTPAFSTRKARVLEDFDPARVWQEFLDRLDPAAGSSREPRPGT